MSSVNEKFDVVINYGRLCKKVYSSGSAAELTAEKAAEVEAALLALFKDRDIVYSDLVRTKGKGEIDMHLTTVVKCTGFTVKNGVVYLILEVSHTKGSLDLMLPV
jgi:hypothetical protein